MTFALALVLKPIFLFGWLCFLASVVISVRKWFPEGRIKQLLLRRVWG